MNSFSFGFWSIGKNQKSWIYLKNELQRWNFIQIVLKLTLKFTSFGLPLFNVQYSLHTFKGFDVLKCNFLLLYIPVNCTKFPTTFLLIHFSKVPFIQTHPGTIQVLIHKSFRPTWYTTKQMEKWRALYRRRREKAKVLNENGHRQFSHQKTHPATEL